jgi:hypothetical protein
LIELVSLRCLDAVEAIMTADSPDSISRCDDAVGCIKKLHTPAALADKLPIVVANRSRVRYR